MDGEEAVLHVRCLNGANPTRLEEKKIVFHACKLSRIYYSSVNNTKKTEKSMGVSLA
jgi:hypothetical protein